MCLKSDEKLRLKETRSQTFGNDCVPVNLNCYAVVWIGKYCLFMVLKH